MPLCCCSVASARLGGTGRRRRHLQNRLETTGSFFASSVNRQMDENLLRRTLFDYCSAKAVSLERGEEAETLNEREQRRVCILEVEI